MLHSCYGSPWPGTVSPGQGVLFLARTGEDAMSDLPFLPCLEPNDAPQPATLGAGDFAYIGVALSLDAFCAYVASYDFGPVLPDQVVIHNTANPDASWAPLGTSSKTWWDRDEADLSDAQIQTKRTRQLDGIRDYYIALGWGAGPHLFFDERWIWLFTPMAEIGVHAKEGNSYRDRAGRLHYTLGCEFVGWFGQKGWPRSMQANARGAIQALRSRLKTFEIIYRSAPAHQPAAHQGGIAFHRDYNKPECPGAYITPEYALPILAERTPPPAPPADPFAAWGSIDRPEGSAQLFKIPQTWLKNRQTLGACLRGERYDLDTVSRALFQGGELRYFAPTGTVELLRYPHPLPKPKEESHGRG